MREESNAENGKDGATELIFDMNRSEGGEHLKCIGLEGQRTLKMDTFRSDVPGKMVPAVSKIVRMGNYAWRENNKIGAVCFP